MNDKPFRPMLAFDADINYYNCHLDIPGLAYWVSPKLDGIRAIVRDGKLLSRTMKPIRNSYTQQLFGNTDLEGLDGELVVGEPYGEGVFARTTSGVMSADGEPDVRYYVFDDITAEGRFVERHRTLATRHRDLTPGSRIELLQQTIVVGPSELVRAEDAYVSWGYEGVIVRDPHAPYKQGRSTPKEGYMGKLKRFKDSEAVITGFEEMMHNDNPATTDARGFTVRSSHLAGQRPSGMLGALRVQDATNEAWVFGIGSGLDHELRKKIWTNREAYTGKIVRYKYIPVGTLEAPRHPIFTGFRDPEDIT
jgi:DNA ligase-1